MRSVLIEEVEEDGRTVGYTDTYIRVHVEGGKPGSVAQVKLTGIEKGDMTGVCVG